MLVAQVTLTQAVFTAPGTQVLTAGKTSFAETHRYREATAKRRHSPGTPLSW